MERTDRRHRSVAGAAALFIALASIAAGLIYINGLVPDPMLPGERVPDSIRISGWTKDGPRRIGILFVSPVCPHCMQALQHISMMPASVRSAVSVIVSGSAEQTASLRARFPLRCVADPEGTAARSFRNSMVPSLLLIDERRILRHRPNIRLFRSEDSLLIVSFLASSGPSAAATAH
ncbi:MAG: hypothetical protein HUU02_00305 [Bacteroidetes bacterium]|nr:hypothetical protein [Bacteroidota bacterium]